MRAVRDDAFPVLPTGVSHCGHDALCSCLPPHGLPQPAVSPPPPLLQTVLVPMRRPGWGKQPGTSLVNRLPSGMVTCWKPPLQAHGACWKPWDMDSRRIWVGWKGSGRGGGESGA